MIDYSVILRMLLVLAVLSMMSVFVIHLFLSLFLIWMLVVKGLVVAFLFAFFFIVI